MTVARQLLLSRYERADKINSGMSADDDAALSSGLYATYSRFGRHGFDGLLMVEKYLARVMFVDG
jgi:hypothetical protein